MLETAANNSVLRFMQTLAEHRTSAVRRSEGRKRNEIASLPKGLDQRIDDLADLIGRRAAPQ